ncbi:hypothetical protein CCACVL1_19328 [Corchorus capsularis]|uniref:Uncharacterized protein n=1 Tax=Corchorus capsularis TaxID=210143 RepID=A0A1R3HH79_COCAP|nr:hypothetical protein CCACVL1_19328 [Corchorus capsularis]
MAPKVLNSETSLFSSAIERKPLIRI